MVEKRLNFNRDVIGQERIYTCGPASTQNILSGLGIHVDEMQLAAECGTHEGGTDHAGLIEPVLNKYAPQAQWQVVWMPNDPCTPQEKEDLWRRVVASIDAGFGVLANFVAPPSNYPRGTRGSQSPNYGGGTVFHYVSFDAYAIDPDGSRHIGVADSGFQPPQYWISLDQAATLIPPKAYIWASAAPLPAAPPPDEAELLGHAMGWSLSLERYRQILPAVKEALRESDCTNPRRVAQWFAQIGHECGGGLYQEELASGEAYNGRSDLGNTQPGDGPRYKGRGAIQCTGRSNYGTLSQWAFDRNFVPTPTYFLDNPEELASDTFWLLGAIWYWRYARPNINSMCDAEDIEGVTRAINGGLHGIDDRRNRYWKALEVADAFVPRPGDAALPPPPPPPPPAPRFWPMESYRIVTSPFGPRWGTIHTGCDFGVEGGSGGKPVYAIQSGTVIHAGTASGYGGGEPGAGWLVIDSDDSQGGGVWEYGHIIAAPGIGVGSKVTAGELIAAINPNEATNGGVAPHLHVSFMPRGYDPGSKQDPLPALEGALEPGVPVAPPAPEPVPDPVPLLVTESVFSAPGTPLTGLPWHHSVEVNDRDLLLNIRAEGLLTQALVFAIAEKVGVDARAVYDAVRESF